MSSKKEKNKNNILSMEEEKIFIPIGIRKNQQKVWFLKNRKK